PNSLSYLVWCQRAEGRRRRRRERRERAGDGEEEGEKEGWRGRGERGWEMKKRRER
ncbi:hypothetical protein BgiMline_012847, partial [Biomphalaria glabrata]